MKRALKDTPSTPFRVPSSIRFVKVDRVTGKFPTPTTPRDQLIFEAFKLTDDIDTLLDPSNDEEGSFFDNEEQAETNQKTGPSGIY